MLEEWRKGSFILVLSDALLLELGTVLSRSAFARKYGLAAEDVAAVLHLAETRSQRARLRRALPVKVRDAKDEVVLATALGGRADYLVTGDADLLVLRDHQELGRLTIVTAKEFLSLLPGR